MINIELFGSQYGFKALVLNAVAGYFFPIFGTLVWVGET